MEGGTNEAKGAGRSGKYEGKGAERDKDKKSTAKPKKIVKEDTAGMNKGEGAERGEYLDTEGEQENNHLIWDTVWPGAREKARKRSIRQYVRGQGRGAQREV